MLFYRLNAAILISALAGFHGTLKPGRKSGGKRVEGDGRMKGVAGVAAVVVAVVGVAVVAIQVTAASSPASLPVAYGFDGGSGWTHGLVKPRAIYFGVGGNLLVRGLTWVSWSKQTAAGRGVRWSDGCVPSCAAGTYLKIPVEILLSRVRMRHGVSYFSRMTRQWTVSGRRYKSVSRGARSQAHTAPPFWS